MKFRPSGRLPRLVREAIEADQRFVSSAPLLQGRRVRLAIREKVFRSIARARRHQSQANDERTACEPGVSGNQRR